MMGFLWTELSKTGLNENEGNKKTFDDEVMMFCSLNMEKHRITKRSEVILLQH